MNEAEQIKRLRSDIAELALENDMLRRAQSDCDERIRMLLSELNNPNVGVVQPFPNGRWSTL